MAWIKVFDIEPGVQVAILKREFVGPKQGLIIEMMTIVDGVFCCIETTHNESEKRDALFNDFDEDTAKAFYFKMKIENQAAHNKKIDGTQFTQN